MKKNLILLAVLILLYLGTGFSLNVIYGDSYPFPGSENQWKPDGSGGWEAHGKPSAPMPVGDSVLPPLIFEYLPMFIPGFVLFLFLFTPLGKMLEGKKEDDGEQEQE